MTRSIEVSLVVQTGTDTSVDGQIPVRVFQVSLKRSLCQLPNAVSYLFYVVSLKTGFRFCFSVEVYVFFSMYPTWPAGGGVGALNSGSG